MASWNTRSPLYKFSLICSYLMFLLYALAFAIPLWLGKNNLILGLWAAGSGDESEIDDLEETGFGESPIDKDWFDAVRGLWVAGAACYLLGIVMSVVENCIAQHNTKDYGLTGIFILLAGLCGGAGVVVTAVEVEDSSTDLDYLWGYIIAVVASGLAIILAIVILITKNIGIDEPNIKSSRTADYVYAHKQGPYAPEYNNPGYRGDELPLVNGVPYHQQAPYGHSPYNMYRTGQQDHMHHHHGSKYEQQNTSYHPYGYKDPRPGNRTSMAESADLSNGYTHDLVNAEHSLSRTRDIGRSQYARGDYFYSGSRPY